MDNVIEILKWGGWIVGGIVGLFVVVQVFAFLWLLAKVFASPQYQREKLAEWEKRIWKALHNHKLYFGLIVLGLCFMLLGLFDWVLIGFELKGFGLFVILSFVGFLPFICLHYISMIRARTDPPEDN